jgi:hypothetical protein
MFCVSLRVYWWELYRPTFLGCWRHVTTVLFKFLMICTEQYAVNCVQVWRKLETHHFHEKKLARQDGCLSKSAYLEQESCLAFQFAERPGIYVCWKVIHLRLLKGHAFTTKYRSPVLLNVTFSIITNFYCAFKAQLFLRVTCYPI